MVYTVLNNKEKTNEQILDYFRFMTITQNVDPNVYYLLTSAQINEIVKYIDAPMTATTFSNRVNNARRSRQQITSELIYYWMVAFNIPFECQKWHLNRLITLIRICEIYNSKPKKRNSKDTLREYAAINAARRKAHNSKG